MCPKIKNRIKSQKKKINKIQISNQPDAEFKILIIRMLNEFRGQVGENFNKETGNIKMEGGDIKKRTSQKFKNNN